MLIIQNNICSIASVLHNYNLKKNYLKYKKLRETSFKVIKVNPELKVKCQTLEFR